MHACVLLLYKVHNFVVLLYAVLLLTGWVITRVDVEEEEGGGAVMHKTLL
jgi:hypothetical protein